MKILLNILDQVIPFLRSYYVDFRQRSQFNVIESASYKYDQNADHNPRRVLSELKQIMSQEQKRNQIIEDKIKALLFIIATSVSIATAITGLVFAKDGNLFKPSPVSLSLFLLGLLYFIAAGLATIRGLAPKPTYGLFLSTILSEKKGELSYNSMTNPEKIAYFYQCIALNQYTTRMRSNFTHAAFLDIRNGLVLFFAFCVSILLQPQTEQWIKGLANFA